MSLSKQQLENEIGAVIAQFATPIKPISRREAIDRLLHLIDEWTAGVINVSGVCTEGCKSAEECPHKYTPLNKLRAEQRSRAGIGEK